MAIINNGGLHSGVIVARVSLYLSLIIYCRVAPFFVVVVVVVVKWNQFHWIFCLNWCRFRRVGVSGRFPAAFQPHLPHIEGRIFLDFPPLNQSGSSK